MLTKELAIFELDGNRILPDCLSRKQHRQYQGYAQEMLRIYSQGLGKTRRELHSAVRRVFAAEPDCRPQRIDAFCKLLDDPPSSEYDADPEGVAPVLRRKVFGLAGPSHPLVEHRDLLFEHGEVETKQSIAATLGRKTWGEIETELFADIFEYHRLKSFAGFSSPEALLSRYNVAQAQAALFFATRLIIYAKADFQRIVTHAKLARLLHDIRPGVPEAPRAGANGLRRAVPGLAQSQSPTINAGYTIILDGPASVMRETRRYGADMAKLLPALLSCRDWRLQADVEFGKFRRKFRLELSSASGLKSAIAPPQEFDSSVEGAFAKKWGTEPRDGWSMTRAGKILQRQQTVFVPDFAFQHETGRQALLEIVGFWTPEYLRAKIEKLKLFADHHIILAAAETVAENWQDIPAGVIRYKTGLKLDDVLQSLADMKGDS